LNFLSIIHSIFTMTENRHLNSIRHLAAQAFSRSAGAPLTSGNAIELLFDSRQNFPAWLHAIEQARESVMIEMYLFADDSFGRRLRDALCEQLKQGVAVYLLYDALGCWREHLSGFFRPLQQAGAEIRAYRPIRLGQGLGLLGRNHRKLIIVDQKQAFVSGLCISSRWEGDPANRLEAWRDTGIRLQGPLVQDAIHAFADSWAFCGSPLALPPRAAQPAGDVSARLIATTPATAHMMRLDLMIASFASRSLWLTDAYFMGTSLYLSALKQAAKEGVDVRLLVPRSSDIGWIAIVSRTLYRPLLEAGVRVFEWNGSMIHAKTAVADGRWARIGSSNLNLSSWMANRELDIAIEDEGLAAAMEQKFLQDLEHATEIVLRGERRRPMLSQPREPSAVQGHPAASLPLMHPGSNARRASAAARQAARIGDALGAVVRGYRQVENSEASAFLSIGLVLLGLALLVGLFPYLLAAPLALVLGVSGVSVAVRAISLYLARFKRPRGDK
jgi:cardiolipin synthase